MKRGELWWAELPAPAGRRPVVLLSRESAYRHRRSITVAPVTTTIRGLPVEVQLGPEDGLPRPCVVNADNLGTFEKRRMLSRIATLSVEKMREVEEAIRFALQLPAFGR